MEYLPVVIYAVIFFLAPILAGIVWWYRRQARRPNRSV